MTKQANTDVRISVDAGRIGDKLATVTVSIHAINDTEIPEDVTEEAMIQIAALFLAQYIGLDTELDGMIPIDDDTK